MTNVHADVDAVEASTINNFRAHAVDLHVGGRIRLRRKALQLSQTQLANMVGLTFQQVQKYETGANRVSASKLHDIAKALKTPIPWFFAGFQEDETAPEPDGDKATHMFLHTPEGAELAKNFPRIGSSMLRQRVLDLVRAMVLEEGASPTSSDGLQ